MYVKISLCQTTLTISTTKKTKWKYKKASNNRYRTINIELIYLKTQELKRVGLSIIISIMNILKGMKVCTQLYKRRWTYWWKK